ncbi:hypothetical protein GOP47_0018269 [Adiantum capillus-veneris]|uniref:Uncharacterized protein n=1 Tax=Adiantum capillus-veneris TaxID=13818 RepID=A0A9D4UI42_ADICA|nr:hypothetical protein GOP47_0018269 [Adiantum capillus-veneris]
MRKKVGKEDWAHGGKKEREESLTMAHRKAAALAWYRHNRKGTNVLGSGKGKMQQSPFSPAHVARHQGNASSSNYTVSDANSSNADQNTQTDMGSGMCVPMSHAPCHNLSPQLNVVSPVPQASRFKAEALVLQSSSSSKPSLPSPHTSIPNNKHNLIDPNKQQLINMSTGQSLALLSLLPHHQSQKCFNLQRKGYGSGDNDDNTATWDCGSSLYDSFELLCLSNQLGRCLTTVNAAAAMASSASSSSRLLRNLTSPTIQGPPLQPSYIPRSLYALPQFMIPNYLVKKASKKRSSLIYPVFSMPSSANGSSPSSALPALPPSASSQGNKSDSVAADQTRKKAESGGFRGVFNSLLKSFHKKDDHKPKRSNLSEELEKLPKHRSLGIGRGLPLLQDMDLNRALPTRSFSAMATKESPTSSSPAATAVASKKSPSSTSKTAAAAAAAAMAYKRAPNSYATPTVQNYYQQHHHFRNEGFRTTSIRPSKYVTKWAQQGA